MDRLLTRYCNLVKISIDDFKKDIRTNELPTYRHIFYYCVKTKYENVKLRHIAALTGKKLSGIDYGVKNIKTKLTPITKMGGTKDLVTPEMQLIKKYVTSFLSICEEYKEKDLKLPER